MSFHVPNQYRIRSGKVGSDDSIGNAGAFWLPPVKPLSKMAILVIASDGDGWEHVSVSFPARCPNWDEMCAVKAIFWDESDCVVQFHPPKAEHINNHSFCLHLWRPIGRDIETPPSYMVGYASLGTLV